MLTLNYPNPFAKPARRQGAGDDCGLTSHFVRSRLALERTSIVLSSHTEVVGISCFSARSRFESA